MPPRLIDHLEFPIGQQQLLDPSIRRAPELKNSWAVLTAWCLDWMMAAFLAQLCVSAWMAFLGPLGFDNLPFATQQAVAKYSEAIRLVLAPLIYFAIAFVGVSFHAMTPGLRLFKHSVRAHDTIGALKWAFGATVSIAALGFPLINNWLDDFALTDTQSQKHRYWLFTKAQHSSEIEPVWNLVELSTGTPVDEEEDFQQAA